MFCFGFVTAQNTDYDYYTPESPKFTNPSEEIAPTAVKSQPRFGLTAGAGIGSFGRGNAFTSTFLAPSLSYSLSPRLNLNAAAMFGNTSFGQPGDFNNNFSPNGFNSKGVMMGLEYKISEHFRVGGSFQYNQGIGGFGHQGFGSPVFGSPFSPMFSPFRTW